MINYLNFKEIFNRIKSPTEIGITFINRKEKYMIIKYDGYITFQRMGNIDEQSGEIRFDSLDDLYKTQTIDNIVLKNEWDNIEDIIIDDWISYKNDPDEFIFYSTK